MNPEACLLDAAALRKRAEALLLERCPQTLETLSPEKTQLLLHELQVHQIELEIQNEEMRRLRAEMEASRARYFDLYDLAPVGYLTVSEAGMVLEANFAGARILGVSRRALSRRMLTSFFFPADQARYDLKRKSLLESCIPQNLEIRILSRDGQPFWAHLELTLNENAEGAPEFRITLSDINERKLAEEALLAERNQLRTLVDLLPAWIFIKDDQSRFLLANQACAINMGASSPEALIGKTHADFYSPEFAERLRLEELDVLSGTPAMNQEIVMESPGGGKCVLLFHKVPLRDSEGRITGLVGAGIDITQLKEAENELRASGNFQRDVLNSLPAHIAVLDPAGIILAVNEPWRRYGIVNGAPPPEKVGEGTNYLKVCQAAWKDGDEYARAAVTGLESILTEKQARFTLEYPCDSPDCVRWFVMEVHKPLNSEVGAIVAHTDITERKIAEESLRIANQKLRLHFEQTPMAVIEWDLDFQVTNWNPAATTIFGYSRREALGRHASFIVPEAARHGVDGVFQALLTKTGGEQSTNANVSQDGTPILCEWYNTALIDEYGAVAGVASVVIDITEQTAAQHLLAWEKSALELIGGLAPLNEVLDQLMLSLEKQLPNSLCSVLLLDDDGVHLRHGAAPSLPEAYNRAIDGLSIGAAVGSCGTAAYAKQQIIVEDIATDPLWVDSRALASAHGLRACWSTPIFSHGKVLGTVAIYHRECHRPGAAELELMERAVHVMRLAIKRKHAEEEIRSLNSSLERRVEERTQELQAVNATLKDFKAALDEHAIVAITDVRGKITYANDNFCEISQYSREELLGQDHRLVNSGYHSRGFFREMWQKIAAGQVWKGEIRNRAKDGSFYWMSSTIVPFLGKGGKPAQFIAIRNDITERKQAEEKITTLNLELQGRAKDLSEANRELEAFSYSVSHDLRAPLRAVDGFSRMVIEDCAAQLDADGQRMLGVIRSETQRMGRLIDDLLAFSRLGRQPIDRLPVAMHEMVQGVFDELAGREPERKLRLDLQSLPIAYGSEPLLRQVWVNLISNALKFSRTRELSEIQIGSQLGEAGEQVYFIKDNGAGFDMRHINKLFGIFQRLHSQEEFAGTGVGLALVQRIVHRHGGKVWAESEIDHGSAFYFTIPN